MVQNNTQAFIRGNHSREPNEPNRSSKDSPPATCCRESEKKSDDESETDVTDAHGSDEEDAGLVTVADGPADEVRVRLAAESSFGDCDGGLEG